MVYRLVGRSAIPSVAVILLWLLLVSLVHAQGPAGTAIKLTVPADGAVGQEITVVARLTN